MRRIARSALAGLLTAGLASGASAATDPFAGLPNLHFQYYDIHGNSPEEIDDAMQLSGPRDADGDSGAALTDYRIAYGWNEVRNGTTCRVANVTVDFAAVIHLPRLVNEAGLSEPMHAEWRKLDQVLRMHEAGHAWIAYDHLDEVKAALAGATCGEERARGEAALNRIERLQEDYDRQTDHGLAQGDQMAASLTSRGSDPPAAAGQ